MTPKEAAALDAVAAVMRASARNLPPTSPIGRELQSTSARLAALAGREAEDGGEQEQRETRWFWKQTPREVRESLLYQALGDERLTIREITARLDAHLEPAWLYESYVRSLVMRLFRTGHIERVGESFQSKIRYRYFRKRGLEGPIAELERAYHDGNGAGA